MALPSALDIIERKESGGKNVVNYKYGPGFTASGHYQITNPTWQRWAKAAGIDISRYPRAIDAPKEVQTAVAAQGYKMEGFRPWEATKSLVGQEANYSGAGPPGVMDSNPAAAPTPYSPYDLSGYTANKGVDTSGFGGALNQGVGRMMEALPPELRGQISIYSGYRSPEKQAQLYQAALQKYGSPEAARKWVAPPGSSQHGFGNASDLRFATPAAREWAHQHAAEYGLAFPLGNEPWHVEAAGARQGGKPVNYALGAPGSSQGGGNAQVASATGGAPSSGQPPPVDPASPEALTQAGMQQLGLLDASPAQPEQAAPVTEPQPASVTPPPVPEQTNAATLMASLIDRKREERGVPARMPPGFLQAGVFG